MADADLWWVAITVWGLCLLGLKMIAIAFYTGYQRKRNDTPPSPEDSRFFNKSEFDRDYSGVDRALSMHRNDIENYIPFILALIAGMLSAVTSSAVTVFVVIFLIARVCHSISYAFGLQPWRSICFGIGLLDTVVFYLAAMTYSVYHLF